MWIKTQSIMKTLTYLFAFWFSMGCITTALAQQPSKILKVSYATNNVSDFMVQTLKAQVKDPEEYSRIMGKAAAYKLYYTLYKNLGTEESLYVLDSIAEVAGMRTVGYCTYTYRDSKKVIYGQETFMGKEVNFTGDIAAMEWDITDETTEINGFLCRKAELKSNPQLYVWFTLDIPVSAGPYLYSGLPGLVLESNSFFQSTTAVQVAYEKDQTAFELQLERIKKEMESTTYSALEKVLIKKENFRRMAEKGKS